MEHQKLLSEKPNHTNRERPLPSAESLSGKVDVIFKIYCIQLLPLFSFFSVGIFITNDNSLCNVLMSVAQNIIYLFFIYFSMRLSRKNEAVYSVVAKEAIFLSQMLTFFIYFCIRGCLGNPNSFSFAVQTISLYFGFSVSLNSLMTVYPNNNFFSCFTSIYMKSGLNKIDWIMIWGYNLGVLCLVSIPDILEFFSAV